MKRLSIILAISIILSACQPSAAAVQKAIEQTQAAYTPTPAPTPTPAVSSEFTNKIDALLKEGAVLNAMTAQGVSYLEFSRQLAITKGAYDLAVSNWPAGYKSLAKGSFDKAFTGWTLALLLWNCKINKYDEPVEPNQNNYLQFINYGGDNLSILVHPYNFIVPQYQGKKYVSFENISVLLSIASNYYAKGQKALED